MKKIVLKVDIHDERDKKKAMKAVSGFTGIDSITVDMKDGKLTLTGHIDPEKEPEKPQVEGKKPNPVPVPTYVFYHPYYHNYIPSPYSSNGIIQNDQNNDSCVICYFQNTETYIEIDKHSLFHFPGERAE